MRMITVKDGYDDLLQGLHRPQCHIDYRGLMSKLMIDFPEHSLSIILLDCT